MDQKNTIVKCKAHPNCLFNHNGVCDNYVINIGADGKCEGYVETAAEENIKKEVIGEYKTINATCGDCEYFGNIDNCPVYKRTHVLFGMDPICLDFKFRGQRAKGNFYDDAVFNICSAACHNYDFKGASLYCQLRQEYLGPERLMKPCDLFVKAENDKTTVKMKIAEFNKPNKNQSVISDWDYAATTDTCKTCKKVVYGQPCKYKNVINGVWTCYEEEIDEV